MKFLKNKIVLTLIAIALIIYLCVGYFFQYSVYYAQHMKHKSNACPEIVMMAHNYKYLPSRLKKIYYMKESGENIILQKNGYNNLSENSGYYFFSTRNFRSVYNKNGQLTNFYLRKEPNVNKVTNGSVKAANKEVSLYLTEYNQELSKPLINLQGLFNYLYEDQFN